MVYTVISCQLKTFEKSKSINNNEHRESINVQTDDKRTYLTDSTYLGYDYQTILKSGYNLEYRVYIESNTSDTLQAIFLMNGETVIKELNEGSDYDLPHKNIGYVGSDFDDSFTFIQSFGSGNPHYFQLIDKKSGKELLNGIYIDVDEDEQVLLYLKDTNSKIDKLMIYDIKNSKEISPIGYEKLICAGDDIIGCIEIDRTTRKEIFLKMSSSEGVVIKKYKR